MDLNKLIPQKADKGATLVIEHPVTGEEIKGMTVTVCGMDSERYQEIKQRKVQETLDQKSSRKAKKLSAKELAEAGVRDLADLTIGWTGFEFGKDEYPFTPENAFKLFTNPQYKWLVEQIDAFVSDRANFFGK